ncbi:MAG TPA: hypothetical protein VFU21_28020 [Kofleriaceae bacterium]|nr:hypothetical protein [Kofleriaceae bacterium]
MRTFRRLSMALCLASTFAVPGAVSAGGSGAKSSSKATGSKGTGGSKALGSQAAGSKAFGQREGVGSKATGTKLGTVAASRAAGGNGTTATTTTTGSKALGSKAAGSKAAGSKALGSKALGSKAAGSRGAPLTLGSQAAGSKAAGSKALGSRAAGSRVTTGSKMTGSKATGSRAGSRFARLVPEIQGSLPKLSSRDPGLLMVIADLSGSMNEGFAGQADIKKADALADVVNGVIGDFVDRMNVGGQIRPRLDVMLEGYGGHGTSSLLQGPLAGKDIVSIADLADNPAAEIDVDDGEGNMIPRPVWVNPAGSGGTPMKAGFSRLRANASRWGRRPAGKHLVLGVHVTDGQWTDADPSQELADLAAEVNAAGGQLLMTNIHLSSGGTPGDAVIFPDEADADKLDEHGKLLFRMSSPVPKALAEKLGTKPGARMMAYNATVEQFARVFEAGSSVAAQ